MATSAKPMVSFNAPKWGEAQKREFDSISRRAGAFSASQSEALFDKDGNVTDARWGKVLADLDAWAAKHKVQLNRSEHERMKMVPVAGGGPVPFASCPVKTTSTETYSIPGSNKKITMKYTCFLRRETLLGRCVFDCTYEFI